MKKGSICIICIGKLKFSFLQQAEKHYRELLEKTHYFSLLEIKDINGKIPEEIKRKKEGEKIAENLPAGYTLLGLWEKGQLYSSMEFAVKLQKLENQNRKLCFIVGGPFGLSDDILKKCNHLVSLSPMTWTQELARILLMEQLYRAYCIIDNRPYHH